MLVVLRSGAAVHGEGPATLGYRGSTKVSDVGKHLHPPRRN